MDPPTQESPPQSRGLSAFNRPQRERSIRASRRFSTPRTAPGRRDDALADLDRLRGELSATIAGHRPTGPANGRDGERAAKEPAKA
jgi:hypothetical protein